AHKQLLAHKRVAVLEANDHAAVIPLDADGRHADPDVDPAGDQRSVNLFSREWLLASNDPRQCFDDGDARTERRPGLAELDSADAAPEDGRRLGNVLGGRSLFVRPGVRLGESGNRWDRRSAARGEYYCAPRAEHPALHVDELLAGNPPSAPDDGHVPRLEP